LKKNLPPLIDKSEGKKDMFK
jgi:dynein heavy chain, axonemal